MQRVGPDKSSLCYESPYQVRKEFYDKKKDIYSVQDLRKAIDIAFHLSSSDDVIIFTGSLYLIGLVRTAIK